MIFHFFIFLKVLKALLLLAFIIFSTHQRDTLHMAHIQSVLDKFVGQIVLVKAYANKIIVFFDNVKIAEHIRTFGLFDWNIKLEHYLNTLHKKSGALENSTAMLNLDTRIKNIYNKYFTQNPKEFLDLYEIILEKGLNNVQKAIE